MSARTCEALFQENQKLRKLALFQQQQIRCLYDPFMYFVTAQRYIGIFYSLNEAREGIYNFLNRCRNKILADVFRRHVEQNLNDKTTYLNMFEQLPPDQRIEFFRINTEYLT